MVSAWITHVKAVYAKGKAGGMKYSEAMKAAKSTYKKKGDVAAPKKKRKTKKKAQKK